MVAWLISQTFSSVWPLHLVALLVLAGVAWHRRRTPAIGVRPPLRILVAVLAAPVLLPLWAAATFGTEHGARGGALGWASGTLTVLALAVVAFAGWAVWRWRANWLAALPCALAAVAGAAMGWFVGAMAIANDWI